MKKIKALYEKYKEYVLYVIFGGVTTIVNYGVYALCFYPLNLSGSISNAIAWVLAVLVAFITNKLWVFESKSFRPAIFFKELGEFALGRLITGIFETAAIALFVDYLGQNALIWKIVTSVVVLIANYIISKLIVFRKKKNPEQEDDKDL